VTDRTQRGPVSTLNFNRELLAGEVGALVLANVTAPAVSHFTRNATVISSTAVAATLVGGSLSWIAARIHDRRRARNFSVGALVGDLGYFTPAALCFGLGLYDPALFLISHDCLAHGAGAWLSVVAGQLAAFSLFLLALNAYRFSLFRFRGKAL
jgi:hypothetical protein